MTAIGSDRTGSPRLRRLGQGIFIVSGLSVLLSVFMLGARMGPAVVGLFTSPTYALPVDTTLTLGPGTWIVFEEVGNEVVRRSVVTTNTRTPSVGPEDISVRRGSSETLPVAPLNFSASLNRNGTVYTGVARFDVPASGQYEVSVTGDNSNVVITPNLGSLVARTVAWIFVLIFSVLGLGAGVLLWVRNRRQAPRAG
ncbi:MAG: hypothetical protein KBB39_13665 [Phycicoccus sp.]|nr:hypothetical protein [Phycicoccus sp.]